MSLFQIERLARDTPDEHFKVKGYSIEHGNFGIVEKIITIDDIRLMVREVLTKLPLTKELIKLMRYDEVEVGTIEEQVREMLKMVKVDLRSDFTDKRASVFAFHSRICIYLLIKYHFRLLSPVYGFGKLWTLRMIGIASEQPSPAGEVVPDDILYHIGSYMDDPKNLSLLSMTKQAMFKRLNVDYFKYVNILPGQVFHRAHLDYQASTDSTRRDMLLALMKTAIEYGAISSIIVNKTDYLYTIWKDIDEKVADILLVEIFNFHSIKMYHSSAAGAIRSYGLPITVHEVVEAMQYYGRVELLLKYVFAFNSEYNLPSRYMHGLEKAPDLQMLEAFRIVANHNRSMLLLADFERRTIDTLYHARLIVDAVKKGLIDTVVMPELYTDHLDLCRGMRELSPEDKALIFPLFTDKVLARFILYGDNPQEVKGYFRIGPKLLVRHGFIPDEEDIISLGDFDRDFLGQLITSEKWFKQIFHLIGVSETRFLGFLEGRLAAFIKVGEYYYGDKLRPNDHFLALKRLMDNGKEMEERDVFWDTSIYNFQTYDPEYPDMSIYKAVNEKALSTLLIKDEDGDFEGVALYEIGDETIYSQMDFLTPMMPQELVSTIIHDDTRCGRTGGRHFFFF